MASTFRRMFFVAFLVLGTFPAVTQTTVIAGSAAPAGVESFIFDDNRMFVELAFVRPDGALRKTLAFVDMGTPALVLSEELGKELQLDQKKQVIFRFGKLEVQVASSAVVTDSGSFRTGPNGRATEAVEAVLPGSIMKDYEVVFDYAQRTLTLAPPGTVQPRGTAVPCRVNEKTGLISVAAAIAGQSYPIAIDSGSAYSWVRNEIAQQWVKAHPDWKRGTGAVGEANMQTRPGGAEAKATILRVPEIRLGSLKLEQIGMLGIAPPAPPFPPVPGEAKVKGDFFDWYSRKTPEPVIGWLGANVLRDFRLTIDFSRHMTYWQQEGESEGHDLNQVGLTLETRDGEEGYFIAGIAEKKGKPTVPGVRAGDQLVQVDGLALRDATRGAIFSALDGKPGTAHLLTLLRDGRRLKVRVKTSAF